MTEDQIPHFDDVPFDPDAYDASDFGPNHDAEIDPQADPRAPEDWLDAYDPREVFGDIPDTVDAVWGPAPGELPTAQSLLADLNPAQADAVQAHHGAYLVVAGAGTGKTRVLTRRIAHLVASGSAQAGQILGVTFTNKAAREMIERVTDLIGSAGREVTLGSFHAVSMMILRRHAVAAGLASSDFQVLDDDEQRQLVEQAMREMDLFARDEPARKRRSRVKQIYQCIMTMKEEGWDVAEAGQAFVPEGPGERDAVAVYARYQAELDRRNAVDFPDLILRCVKLFDTRPDIKRAWVQRFSHVLVDEFQDTNVLQYRWLEHLARERGNLCVVGDPDQALYQWRGARPEILHNFADDWPGCRTIVLDRNYRSTEPILQIANKVVAANPRPAPKELSSGVTGAAIDFQVYTTQFEEADAIAGAIRRRLDAGTPPQEIAILLRSARPMLAFEQALTQAGIDHEVVGGMRYVQREEVKDIHAYMRLALAPGDDLAFQRVANKPLRQVGDKTVEQVVAQLPFSGGFAEACRVVADTGQRISRHAKQGLNDLADLLDALTEAAQGMRPGELIREIVQRTDYIAWRRDGLSDPNWKERQGVLEDLAANADTFRSTASYLQQVAVAAAQDNAQGGKRVRISTVHAAKGLEFDVVFTPALEEGVLPNMAALQQDYGLAEERRIAHVAWTRARKELVISYALLRWNQPAEASRFLVDAELLDAELRGSTAPMHQRRRQQMQGASKQAGIQVSGFHRMPRRKR